MSRRVALRGISNSRMVSRAGLAELLRTRSVAPCLNSSMDIMASLDYCMPSRGQVRGQVAGQVG